MDKVTDVLQSAWLSLPPISRLTGIRGLRAPSLTPGSAAESTAVRSHEAGGAAIPLEVLKISEDRGAPSLRPDQNALDIIRQFSDPIEGLTALRHAMRHLSLQRKSALLGHFVARLKAGELPLQHHERIAIYWNFSDLPWPAEAACYLTQKLLYTPPALEAIWDRRKQGILSEETVQAQ
ncbi:hypothetical protein SAMN05216359_102538 [Roseateles sp. YR242]|uniref:hypothetical protein n=1 Tax=Roseateles sp. YR242 TaxID=1855305 RepID=UPI0008D4B2D3|nr:hypothetical protein [Roseateles sp. YR242]SEK64825.1 hypothetical protein SAMN05216359_102538 [Roseateles sp. YR242]